MAEAKIVMRTFQFKVAVDGKEIGQFSEVSGFDVSYDPIEYRAGDSAGYTTQKFPGLAKYGNVTLKRGVISNDNAFFNWVNENVGGKYKKCSVTITLTDPAEEGSQAVWTLSNAWVTKYTGPDLKGDASELAMETLELAHEGCMRTDGGTSGSSATNLTD